MIYMLFLNKPENVIRKYKYTKRGYNDPLRDK